MTLDEAKEYLGARYVFHPDYSSAANPQHNPYEPVNIRLTFAHIKHGRQDEQED